jgi:hypothetical protein
MDAAPYQRRTNVLHRDSRIQPDRSGRDQGQQKATETAL